MLCPCEKLSSVWDWGRFRASTPMFKVSGGQEKRLQCCLRAVNQVPSAGSRGSSVHGAGPAATRR